MLTVLNSTQCNRDSLIHIYKDFMFALQWKDKQCTDYKLTKGQNVWNVIKTAII